MQPAPRRSVALEEVAMSENDRKTETVRLGDGPGLPLVVHRGALAALQAQSEAGCKRLFARHHWTGAWTNGIYAYHHFHALTHEALGIVDGSAEVQFGGDAGPVVAVAAGDVVVIPAGVSHKRRASSGNLVVIGAYPGRHAPDHDPDIERGESAGHAPRFAKVKLPEADPAFGPGGPLMQHWHRGG